MEPSRLPLPSLLGLCGALLMLSTELLLGMPEDSSNVPITNPGVARALAFAVEKYNRDREDSTNYFKLMRVLTAQMQVEDSVKFSFLAQMVKTTCAKIPSWNMSYMNIQKCKRLPGNQEKPICFFKVAQILTNMELEATSCT